MSLIFMIIIKLICQLSIKTRKMLYLAKIISRQIHDSYDCAFGSKGNAFRFTDLAWQHMWYTIIFISYNIYCGKHI
jgi:NADH:ubiquinone oxidoreductase subunit 3 (subunit A)